MGELEKRPDVHKIILDSVLHDIILFHIDMPIE